MTSAWLDDEEDDQPVEQPSELSEEQEREKRYQEEAAQKLTKGGGLDEPMPKLRRNLIAGAALTTMLALGGVGYALSKTRATDLGPERQLTRKEVRPTPVPEVFKNLGKPEPEPPAPDAYDQVNPSDPAFTTPITSAREQKYDEMNCPAAWTREECEEAERRRLAGEPINKVQRPHYASNTHSTYTANPGRDRPGHDFEDEGMLAPMGYYGGTKPSFVASAPAAAPEMAPMGLPAQPGLQLPGNLAAALEKAANAGNQDPDDVKEAFAARPGTLDGADDERELGECELTAGTVIHVANLSAINTDVPAKSSVTASVTQTVRCGPDNQYVAIPQGSTFTASANARVSYGDERIQLCLEQLKRPPSRERPNGSIVPVKCWAAADITGMVGWAGEVDNHWNKLIAGVALSTFLSLGTTSVAGNQEGFAPTIAQRAASQAGMQFNQAGQKIVNRDLQRKPTITRKMLQSGTVVITENKPMTPWQARKAKRRTW